jgi:hypothetical protein
MKKNILTSLNIVEIRQHVLLELGDCEQASKPWLPSKKRVSRQINFLIVTYVALASEFGIAPYGDMLPHLGWPGQVLYELFCTTAGAWEAFRRLVERSYGLPWRTSLIEGNIVLQSLGERFVYRGLVALSGVTHVEPHPFIPGGSGRKRADFRVESITGLSVYVEVAMVASQGDGERPFLAEYREDLLRKIEFYNKAGIDPVIIWADEAASPRILAERLNDIRARLGLPTRPPAPLAWYEAIV